MRLPVLKAVALDVDGVLTDGGVWWGPDGGEWKRFCFADIMGVSLALQAGLQVTLISGEDSQLVERFAAKFGLRDFTKGCKDKAAALRDYGIRQNIDLSAICYMGDDVNDLAAMALAGLAAAPANAHRMVLAQAGFISSFTGGNGAVRDLMDTILEQK